MSKPFIGSRMSCSSAHFESSALYAARGSPSFTGSASMYSGALQMSATLRRFFANASRPRYCTSRLSSVSPMSFRWCRSFRRNDSSFSISTNHGA